MNNKELYWTKRWREIRERHLWNFPFCIHCQSTFNLQVDHIIEHKGNEELFWNEKNLQTLCINCHGKKSGIEYKIQQLKPGTWTLTLKNAENQELKTYFDFYNDYDTAIKRYFQSQNKNPYNITINVKTFNISEICKLINEIIIFKNSIPKIIEIDQNLEYYDLLKFFKKF